MPADDRLSGMRWVLESSPRALKRLFQDAWSKAADSPQGQISLIQALEPLLGNPLLSIPRSLLQEEPYPGLGRSAGDAGKRTSKRTNVVFITARFRSGSTLLWSLFRALPGVTAYYEPLNEREWFRADKRGEQVDRSHRGVGDYWAEYVGKEFLGEVFDPRWTDRNLFMAEKAWAPNMKRYIVHLVDSAEGVPVLAFNRIDFRLSWIRHQFPNAKIVHLYRHPRDQWCSSLLDITKFPANSPTQDFSKVDHFYLLQWVEDLVRVFPFLRELENRHPYALFYAIWKMSFLHGRYSCDYSLRFEDLVTRPSEQISRLLAAVGIETDGLENLVGIVDPPRLGKWPDYAGPDWFSELESDAEDLLEQFLLSSQALKV